MITTTKLNTYKIIHQNVQHCGKEQKYGDFTLWKSKNMNLIHCSNYNHGYLFIYCFCCYFGIYVLIILFKSLSLFALFWTFFVLPFYICDCNIIATAKTTAIKNTSFTKIVHTTTSVHALTLSGGKKWMDLRTCSK